MPIRYYSGVEGSCKSTMMTRDLYMHRLSRGEVMAFPGYELYGDNKRQVLSDLMMPEQILTLLREDSKLLRRRKIALAIDEVGSFMNHHAWWNKICDIMAAIMGQRRKLGIALLMTGPIFGTLPPDIRNLIHEVVYCTDLHTLNHAVPRGEKCVYYKEDCRGLLSNPHHRFSRRKIFFAKPWWRHFDTYAPVDIIHQFINIKFQGRQIIVGPDGNVLNDGYKFDQSKADKIIQKHQPVEDPRFNQIKETVKYLKGKGIDVVETPILCQLLNVPHLIGRNGIGSILKSLGAVHKPNKGVYDLSGVMN